MSAAAPTPAGRPAPAVSPAALHAMLQDGAEIALVDVREEGAFSRNHLLFAACVPLSHLELRIDALVPRRDVRMVLTDGGAGDAGLAQRAAQRLHGLGYTSVAVLDGGTAAWQAAGYETFSGVNVPSKAFGEFVEHWYETPRLPATEVEAMRQRGDRFVILDSRPLAEYRRMSIPGGIDCPGAELVYRVHEMAPDPDTTIIVNCAGRTRSIIGAQSLINAGVPNKVYALKDGTMGWTLAGLTLDHGRDTHAPPPGDEALARARARAAEVARRFGVQRVDGATVQRWQDDPRRTTMLLDVRTEAEYRDGHWPGARHAPGGQLVQATDEYVATRGARLVLADAPDGVRATMTAHWLIQLGWSDVHVLVDAPPAPELGMPPATARPVPVVPAIDVATLRAAIDGGYAPVVVDLASSLAFRKGHLPGAYWGVRARMADCLGALTTARPDALRAPQGAAAGQALPALVLASPDGVLARLAAHDLAATHPTLPVRVLAGGTDAWSAAGGPLESGLDRTLTDVDDVWWKPYDHAGGAERAMKEYLDWEVGLVAQIERDGLARFRRF